jgi:hypothetical protein
VRFTCFINAGFLCTTPCGCALPCLALPWTLCRFFPDSRLSLDLNTDKTLKASQQNSGLP